VIEKLQEFPDSVAAYVCTSISDGFSDVSPFDWRTYSPSLPGITNVSVQWTRRTPFLQVCTC